MLSGAILVFLPGYDEIITVRDRIQDEKRFSDSSRSVSVNHKSSSSSSYVVVFVKDTMKLPWLGG